MLCYVLFMSPFLVMQQGIINVPDIYSLISSFLLYSQRHNLNIRNSILTVHLAILDPVSIIQTQYDWTGAIHIWLKLMNSKSYIHFQTCLNMLLTFKERNTYFGSKSNSYFIATYFPTLTNKNLFIL